MRLYTRCILIGALITFFLSVLNGCSLIGLGVGSAIDASNKTEWRKCQEWQRGTIKPGTKIRIIFRDGDTLVYDYSGIGWYPQNLYAEAYAKVPLEGFDGLKLPPLYDTVRVNKGLRANFRANNVEGEFLGFGYQSVGIRTGANVWLLQANRVSGSILVFDQGVRMSSRDIVKLTSSGRVPLLSTIRVEGDAYRIDQISQVQAFKKRSNTKQTLFFAGAGVDVAIFVILAIVGWDYGLGGG